MKFKKVLFSLFIMFLSTLVVYADTAPQSITINGSNLTMLSGYSYFTNYVENDGLNVTLKVASSGNTTYITYCKDPDKLLYNSGSLEYAKGAEITDSHKLGVLVNGYSAIRNGINSGDTNKDYYITNLALWTLIGSTNKLNGVNCTNNTYHGEISSTVTSACSLANTTYTKTTSSISVNNSNVNMTLDGNYYISSAIGVNLSSNVTNYTVTLGNGAPTGTEVIDKSNTSFKIRVPKGSVNSSTSFGITITATYENYAAYEYDPVGHNTQAVALLIKENETKSTNLTLNIPVTPQTTTTAPITTTIKIYKYIAGTTTPLPGAGLTLIRSNNSTVATWTTSDSPKTITDLTDDDYMLKEYSVPSGYEIDNINVIGFRVRNGVVIKQSGAATLDGNTIIIYNTPVTPQVTKFSVKVLKTDYYYQPLSGASFVLKDSNNQQVGNPWTSDENSYYTSPLLTPGIYTIHETQAPPGYIAAPDITFELKNDGTVINVGNNYIYALNQVFTNGLISVPNMPVTETPPSITVNKVKADGQPLTGAIFKLQKVGESTSQTIDLRQTAATTITVSAGSGDYTLTESTTPSGYNTVGQIKIHIDASGVMSLISGTGVTFSNGNKTIIIANSPITTTIKIVKKDENGDNLTGAKFDLYKDTTKIQEIDLTSNASKSLTLNTGDYTLTETKAPNDYTSIGSIKFKIDSSGTISLISGTGVTLADGKKTMNIANSKITTTIKIVKKDENGNNLKGAKFDLYKDTTKIQEIDLTSNASASLTLNTGDYTLTETTAPSGYKTIGSIEFSIDSSGTISSVSGTGVTLANGKKTINIANAKVTGKVTIIKKDSKTNGDLTGAKFKLQKTNAPTSEETITFTAASVIKNLIPGDYTLTEIEAPEGYELDPTPFKFKITSAGVVTNDKGTRITGGKITMYNDSEPQTGEAYISKRDMTTGEELPGAHLKVVDSHGNLIKEWVSTDTPMTLPNLEPGTYTLSETIAPEGYNKSTETINFTIDEDGKLVGGTVVMYNEPKQVYGKATISKRDANTGKELEGAVLVLKDSDGNVVDRWTTTKTPYTVDKLLPGETYTLSEESAPKKYILNKNDITFTVDDNGQVSGTIIMNNYPDEVTTNEQTGSTLSIVVLITGLLSLGYIIYATIQNKKNRAQV